MCYSTTRNYRETCFNARHDIIQNDVLLHDTTLKRNIIQIHVLLHNTTLYRTMFNCTTRSYTEPCVMARQDIIKKH